MLQSLSLVADPHFVRCVATLASPFAGGTTGRIVMAGKLTALGIGRLKRPGKFYDGAYGLFLHVFPTGAKCWRQRLTVAGKRRTRGLGGYPDVSLADVRVAACTNWVLVRDGRDPFPKIRKAVRPTSGPLHSQSLIAVSSVGTYSRRLWSTTSHPPSAPKSWPRSDKRTPSQNWPLGGCSTGSDTDTRYTVATYLEAPTSSSDVGARSFLSTVAFGMVTTAARAARPPAASNTGPTRLPETGQETRRT